MIEIFTSPLARLTLLFAFAIVTVMVLRRIEPAWKIALIRGAFIGGLLLFLIPLSGLRWEMAFWSHPSESVPPAATASLPVVAAAVKPAIANANSADKAGPLSFLPYLPALWLIVASILLIRVGRTLHREQKRFCRGVEAPAGLVRRWAGICAEIGTTARGVVIVPENISPHLLPDGTLVLPSLFLDQKLNEATQRHVLRHEAAHLKAGDQIWFPLLAVLTSILWFHPLAWWLRSRHLVACEEARDAEAARLGGAGAYRSSVARIALGLMPSTSPVPGLLRKQGRLMARLNRVEETMPQSPPVRAAVIVVQAVLVVIAIFLGTAAPSIAAAASVDQLSGVWRAIDPGERFARQVEIYEWGGKVKLRIWHAVGPDRALRDATILPFPMNRREIDAKLHADGSVSLDYSTGFSSSIYSLSVRNGELQFGLKTTYTDDSGRADLDHVSRFERGEWLASTE